MAATPWLFPSVAVAMTDLLNGNPIGSNTTNANNAQAEDNVFASIRRGANGQREDAPLRVAGFPVNAHLPAGAVVTGLEVLVSRYAQAAGAYDTAVSDQAVRLVMHSGRTAYRDVQTGQNHAITDQIGSNLASSAVWPTAKATALYGGATQMWGAGLTDAQIRDPNLGLDLLILGGGKGAANGYIDSIQLRVHYDGGGSTEPEPEPTPSRRLPRSVFIF